MHTQTPPISSSTVGVPKPTAIMASTSGEKESTGGEPAPSSTVLEGRRRVRRSLGGQEHNGGDGVAPHAPAEELGAVVERFPRQTEAHVEAEGLWRPVEASDQAGSCRRLLRALRPRVGVAARRGELQRRVGLPVGHRLPLEVTRDIGAAVSRGHPLGHLRGQRSQQPFCGLMVYAADISHMIVS